MASESFIFATGTTPLTQVRQATSCNLGPTACAKTPGADFVFRQLIQSDRTDHIVNASGLNDFFDTNLAAIIAVSRRSGAGWNYGSVDRSEGHVSGI